MNCLRWPAACIFALGLGLGLPAMAEPESVPDPSDPTQAPYRVQPGDLLLVSVWKEEDLVREVLVRPDGGLSFPLVNDIAAAGLTIAELQAAISTRLARYIPDPVVTVSIRELLGNKIYVIGKVNRPGEFQAGTYVDVIQALSMAGGMTPYAAADKIKVLRREQGQLRAIPFDYTDIEKGRNLEQDILLKSRDIVLVP